MGALKGTVKWVRNDVCDVLGMASIDDVCVYVSIRFLGARPAGGGAGGAVGTFHGIPAGAIAAVANGWVDGWSWC